MASLTDMSSGFKYDPVRIQDRMVAKAGLEWDTDKNIAALVEIVRTLIPKAEFKRALSEIL